MSLIVKTVVRCALLGGGLWGCSSDPTPGSTAGVPGLAGTGVAAGTTTSAGTTALLPPGTPMAGLASAAMGGVGTGGVGTGGVGTGGVGTGGVGVAGMDAAGVGAAGTTTGTAAGTATAGDGTAGTAAGTGAGMQAAGTGADLEPFSFFVASLEGMQRLSGSQDGFGGDLRYGETDGLSGADKICTELAEHSMPGAGAKGWRAFLSVSQGPQGGPVNAIDRVGEGPWYDRLGRLVAMTRSDLLNERPNGAHAAIVNDLPNEYGVPNQTPDPTEGPVDNHHVLTGSEADGELYAADATCGDWTQLTNAGRPRVGFSWPAGNRQHWISGQNEGGCGAGVLLTQSGGSDPSNPIVGSGGGYGGIYCFALMP